MSFSDETLMAYADGELDAETRRAIEAAMASDAAIAAAVAQHRARREQLRAAFAPIADESVPEFLLSTAREAPVAAATPANAAPANVVSLTQARAAKVPPATAAPARRSWSWPEWSSIAATLVLGVIGGRLLMSEPDALVAQDGRVIAGGALAKALSEQPGGTRIAESP